MSSDFIVILFAEYAHYFVLGVGVLVFLVGDSGHQKWRLTKIALISSIVAVGIDKLLNQIINSPRPFVVDDVTPLFTHLADNGFPSEHTLLAVVVSLLIYLRNKKIGFVLLLVAMTIGIARVLAGVHHMVDIIGAVLIGAGAVVVGQWVVTRYSDASLSE